MGMRSGAEGQRKGRKGEWRDLQPKKKKKSWLVWPDPLGRWRVPEWRWRVTSDFSIRCRRGGSSPILSFADQREKCTYDVLIHRGEGRRGARGNK